MDGGPVDGGAGAGACGEFGNAIVGIGGNGCE